MVLPSQGPGVARELVMTWCLDQHNMVVSSMMQSMLQFSIEQFEIQDKSALRHLASASEAFSTAFRLMASDMWSGCVHAFCRSSLLTGTQINAVIQAVASVLHICCNITGSRVSYQGTSQAKASQVRSAVDFKTFSPGSQGGIHKHSAVHMDFNA